MQYVFLIRCRAGCKKYVTWLRVVTYLSQPALERIKNTYCMGKRPFLYFYWNQLDNRNLLQLHIKQAATQDITLQ